MTSLHNAYQKLMNAFRAAYHEKECTEISDHWQTTVMREIRRLGPLNIKAYSFAFANQVVWRFATVAGIMALMLSAYIFYTGFSPETEIVSQFLSDPVSYTLVQVLGG
jgi:hypothetical protein